MSNDESNVHKVYLLCKKEEEVRNKCVSAYLCRKNHGKDQAEKAEVEGGRTRWKESRSEWHFSE